MQEPHEVVARFPFRVDRCPRETAIRCELAEPRADVVLGVGRLRDEPRLLDVDTVIICAGQESENALAAELRRVSVEPEVIGGAERAGELDALRAIEQGTRVALAL